MILKRYLDLARRRVGQLMRNQSALLGAADVQSVLLGRLLAESLRGRPFESLEAVEFKVFSQFGDDGIIQYLVHRLGVPRERRVFVEFGVEDYRESNTRFLLAKDNWRGLVIDGSEANVDRIRGSDFYWRHDLDAQCAWIDRDNINSLIESAGVSGPIGILSIDVDGNDYWIWERLTCVDPMLVIAEYNPVFGAERAVTIPYDPKFFRTDAHHSNLYWGASLAALNRLAARKGFDLIGCNSSGNNAYFVRRELRPDDVPALDPAEAYRPSKFRESRSATGALTFLRPEDQLGAIAGLEVFDVDRQALVSLADLQSSTAPKQ